MDADKGDTDSKYSLSDTDSEYSQAGNPYNFAYGDKYIDEHIRPFIPQLWHSMNFQQKWDMIEFFMQLHENGWMS